MTYIKLQETNAGADFLEVMFDTSEPTQARHIQEKSGGLFSFVTGCNPMTGKPYPNSQTNTTSTRFIATIQNPSNLDRLCKIFSIRLGTDLTSFRLHKLELYVDTYCKRATVSDLAKIAFDRYRFYDDTDAHDWYFYRKRGEGRQYVNTLYGREFGHEDSYRAAIRLLTERYMLGNAENANAPKRVRTYVKTWDKVVDGIPTIELPQEQWRARIEVRLEGDALPCQTLDELRQLDMRKLINKHFKFRTLSETLHPAVRCAIQKVSISRLGARGCYRRPTGKITPRLAGRYSGIARYRRSTQADNTLAKRIDAAARRFNREWRKKRSADFSPHSESSPQVRRGSHGFSSYIRIDNT